MTGANPRKPESSNGLFVHTTGGLLLITGAAKFWSTFGGAKLLAVADPITGIQFRYLMLAVGLMELAVAFVCLFTGEKTLATYLIGWLATSFLVYRLGLRWINWESPCNCLGNLTDVLHISPQLADNIMKITLVYMLIGSYALLFRLWRTKTSSLAVP